MEDFTSYAAETAKIVAACHARQAQGLCCVRREGVEGFRCDRAIDPTAECWICEGCQQDEDDREGWCDGEADRRMNGNWRDE